MRAVTAFGRRCRTMGDRHSFLAGLSCGGMMILLANEINQTYFRELEQYANRSHKIEAAVAYITDDTIFKAAREHSIPIRIWARIDEDVLPATLDVLRKNAAYAKGMVYATDDYLHAKVIWFHGVGCYIGSANLTAKALHNNIEIGVLVEEHPDHDQFFSDMRAFFHDLCEYTSILHRADIDRIIDVFNAMNDSEAIRGAERRLREAREPYLRGWRDLSASLFGRQKTPLRERSTKSRSEHRFVKEWKETYALLEYCRDLYVGGFQRPKWVEDEDVPIFSELDRMLSWHYECIRDPQRKIQDIIQELSNLNRGHGEANIRRLFADWSRLSAPPGDVLDSFKTRVPLLRQHLAKNRILSLTTAEFAEVVQHCYALMDHIDQFKALSALGVSGAEHRVPREEKARAYVERFLAKPNAHGRTAQEILHHFIWDDSGPVEERLWRCTGQASEWKFPGIDRSTLGELIGLARPEDYPIRNNRISRVLAALGFEVDWV